LAHQNAPHSQHIVVILGVLVVLDPRVRRQRYGKAFLASLRPYRMAGAITDVEAFFETKAG
jgi:Rad3-related DNA helicase